MVAPPVNGRAVPPPRAVLRGRGALVWLRLPCSLLLFVPLGAASAFVTGGVRDAVGLDLRGAPGPVAALGVLVAMVGVGLAHRWAHARSGGAEVFHDRVIHRGPDGLSVVFLDQVEAFEDASADFVVLHAPPQNHGLARCTITVPTRDEAGRAALLDALARAGVPRGVPDEVGRALTPRKSPRLDARRHATVTELGAVMACCAAGALAALVGGRPGAVFAAGALVACLAILVHLALVEGEVHFHDDRVALGAITVSWDDLVGWRDRGPRRLRLVLRPGLLRAGLFSIDPAVPTPTPETRAAVEALLADKGVPRL